MSFGVVDVLSVSGGVVKDVLFARVEYFRD